MRIAIFNAVKVLIGLALIGLGWYGIGYGFAESTGNSNLYFFGGFLIFVIGGGIILHVILTAKDQSKKSPEINSRLFLYIICLKLST